MTRIVAYNTNDLQASGMASKESTCGPRSSRSPICVHRQLMISRGPPLDHSSRVSTLDLSPRTNSGTTTSYIRDTMDKKRGKRIFSMVVRVPSEINNKRKRLFALHAAAYVRDFSIVNYATLVLTLGRNEMPKRSGPEACGTAED